MANEKIELFANFRNGISECDIINSKQNQKKFRKNCQTNLRKILANFKTNTARNSQTV